jgi:tetratricopeptide (TPR) repeat protein
MDAFKKWFSPFMDLFRTPYPDAFAVYSGDYWRRRGDGRASLTNLNRAIAANPRDAHYYSERARVKLTQDDPNGALHDADQALTLAVGEPERAGMYLLRGCIHAARSDHDLAIEDFSSALKQKLPAEQEIAALLGRARAYEEMGQRESAIEDLGRALRILPEKMEVRRHELLISRALNYQQMSRINEAIKDYSLALEFDPENVEARFNRGLLCIQTGDVRVSILDLERVTRQYPQHSVALNGLAFAHLLSGDTKAAIGICIQALTADPENPAIYDTRAHIHFAAEDYHSALSDFRRVVTLSKYEPTMEQAGLLGQAITHFALGRYALAKEAWQSLVTMNPEFSSLETIQQHYILPTPFIALMKQYIELSAALE